MFSGIIEIYEIIVKNQSEVKSKLKNFIAYFII